PVPPAGGVARPPRPGTVGARGTGGGPVEPPVDGAGALAGAGEGRRRAGAACGAATPATALLAQLGAGQRAAGGGPAGRGGGLLPGGAGDAVGLQRCLRPAGPGPVSAGAG